MRNSSVFIVYISVISKAKTMSDEYGMVETLCCGYGWDTIQGEPRVRVYLVYKEGL